MCVCMCMCVCVCVCWLWGGDTVIAVRSTYEGFDLWKCHFLSENKNNSIIFYLNLYPPVNCKLWLFWTLNWHSRYARCSVKEYTKVCFVLLSVPRLYNYFWKFWFSGQWHWIFLSSRMWPNVNRKEENSKIRFLRNVGKFIPHYRASLPKNGALQTVYF